jgi:hypothetical protein
MRIIFSLGGAMVFRDFVTPAPDSTVGISRLVAVAVQGAPQEMVVVAAARREVGWRWIGQKADRADRDMSRAVFVGNLRTRAAAYLSFVSCLMSRSIKSLVLPTKPYLPVHKCLRHAEGKQIKCGNGL